MGLRALSICLLGLALAGCSSPSESTTPAGCLHRAVDATWGPVTSLAPLSTTFRGNGIVVDGANEIHLAFHAAGSETARGTVALEERSMRVHVEEAGNATSVASFIAGLVNETYLNASMTKWTPFKVGEPCVGPLADETNTTGVATGAHGTGTI